MRYGIATTALLFLVLGACRESDLGTGANTLDREYTKTSGEAWSAAVSVCKAAGLTVEERKNDALGGELIARRATESEVRIDVKALDERRSRVSVRVGDGDRELARMLQERIADRLGLGPATGGLFGGNSLDGTYSVELVGGRTAARHTYWALDISFMDEEVHAAWARLDGRLKNATPVRIRMEVAGDAKLKVTFIAGNEKNDDNLLTARRMKEEFEKRCPADRVGN